LLPLRLVPVHCALVAAAALFPLDAWTGRPLGVDDANVSDVGHGHLELWFGKAPDAKVFNAAPAYSPIERLELGALLARDTEASATLRGVQAKWLITPSRQDGCNAGAAIGWLSVAGMPNTASLNGLLTCNRAQYGSVHLNLGLSKARSAASNLNWGIAYEKPFDNGLTPNIEWFGAQRAKPTLQAGLRGNIAPNLQLDGSIGRRDRMMLYTVGTKLQF
jgi:hypothetical protein